VPDDQRFATMFSSYGGVHLPTLFLEVSVFQGESPQVDLGGCTWQWRLSSRCVVEGIV
jgi:hypothetical protein